MAYSSPIDITLTQNGILSKEAIQNASDAQKTANSANTTAGVAQTTASGAQSAAKNAQTTAEEAHAVASGAQSAANDAQATAGEAQAAANGAQTVAETAHSAATDAQTTASSAQTTAQAAQTTANSANTAAGAAHTAANNAQSTAETAQTTASGAQTTAKEAQTTASSAQTTAGAAQSAASSAQTTANGAQKAATDAQTTASGAQTTAQAAHTAASSAQATAKSAQETAGVAQTTASGAQTTAEAAHKAANDAQTTASGAQVTAKNAQSTAENAQTVASSAQTTANSAKSDAATASAAAANANTNAEKAVTDAGEIAKTYFSDEVYYQSDEPAGATAGALWFKIDTTEQFLNYHDDSTNGGTGTTTKTVTVKVSNEGLKVNASGTFTWNGQQPINTSPSLTGKTRAYTYNGLSATYSGKIIASGVLWCFYKSYNGGTAYVPIKDLASGKRYGTDNNAASDPAAYHTETQTVTVNDTTGNAVNDSQITLKMENVTDVQSYVNNAWSSIPFQKQLVGAQISGASIDAPLISLGDGGVIWSSYSITQDPRFYVPIASQGTVAMAQGELIASGQTQYYDSDTGAWSFYNSTATMQDGDDTNYTTTIINAGGIKNEMQDSARANVIGRTYMNAVSIKLDDGKKTIFSVDPDGLSHSVGITTPDLYATKQLHTTLVQPDGPTDALRLESGVGYSRVQSKSIYNVTNSHGANVYITASGSLVRTASASKYKADIHEMADLHEQAAALLQAVPKYWFDKPSVENVAESLNKGTEPDVDASTAEQGGLIAEDLEKLGLNKYLYYGENNELEGVDYSKLWVLLLPTINDIIERINKLEKVKQ